MTHNKRDLSSPGPLESAEIWDYMRGLPAEAVWDLYQVLNSAERKQVYARVRATLAATSADHFPPLERHKIEREFGLTLLPSPQPIDGNASQGELR